MCIQFSAFIFQFNVFMLCPNIPQLFIRVTLMNWTSRWEMLIVLTWMESCWLLLSINNIWALLLLHIGCQLSVPSTTCEFDVTAHKLSCLFLSQQPVSIDVICSPSCQFSSSLNNLWDCFIFFLWISCLSFEFYPALMLYAPQVVKSGCRTQWSFAYIARPALLIMNIQ